MTGVDEHMRIHVGPQFVIKWKGAKYFDKGRGAHKVKAVVIHTAECGETSTSAEGVAEWFANKDTRKASAHYCVDNDSIVQCVLETDTAWHAGSVNGWTVGIELAGKANQTLKEWQDEYSMQVLANAAKLCRDICDRWQVPIVKLSPEQAKAGGAGIFGHCDVSGKGGHWDPGPSFDFGYFLDLVRGD
jgi:N-acetyl-anhydromuramyl-L-alanine amidase AmpD